jgi:hypothetical protein
LTIFKKEIKRKRKETKKSILRFWRLRERQVASIDCGQQTPAREAGHDDDENCPDALVDGGLRSAQPGAGPVVVESLPLQPVLFTPAYVPSSLDLRLSLFMCIFIIFIFIQLFIYSRTGENENWSLKF